MDRFPAEPWTTPTGILDRFPAESVDHFDRNPQIGMSRYFLQLLMGSLTLFNC